MNVIKSLCGGFCLAQLEVCHAQKVFELWEKLPADKKQFVAKKSVAEIVENLSAPNYAIGFFDKNGGLVSSAFLLDSPHDALRTDLDISALPEKFQTTGPTGVIATVIVDPKAAGSKLMLSMLDHLLNVAVKKGYESVSARVVEGNEPPWSIFRKAGFDVVTTANHTDSSKPRRGLFLCQLTGKHSDATNVSLKTLEPA